MTQHYCRWIHQKAEGSGLLQDVQLEDVSGLVGQDNDLDVSDYRIPSNVQAGDAVNWHGDPECVCHDFGHGLDEAARRQFSENLAR